MLICQGVVYMLASPPPDNQVLRSQHAQALGNSRKRFLLGNGEFRDAHFALRQAGQQTKPGRLSDCAKEARSSLQRGLINQRPSRLSAVFIGAAHWRQFVLLWGVCHDLVAV
ncbi:MAG: hypothetical protein JWP63_1542 [Candidatus Solibacter sp.]|nr:hypothetical protein [Candidatus Solibacter sp.]